MKTILVILCFIAKDLARGLRDVAKHAPDIFKESWRDIMPAIKEYRSFFRNEEISRFSTRLLPLPGERNQREANLRGRIVRGAVIFFFGAGVGGVLATLLLTYGWLAYAIFLLAMAAVIALELGLLYRESNYLIGHLGERKVGEALEKYVRRPGYHVFHGFHIDGNGDVDHIVVCPHGVFCVETKALRKYPDEAKLIYTPPASPMSTDSIGEVRTDRGRVLNKKNPMEQNKDNAVALLKILGKFDGKNGAGQGGGKVYVRRIVFFPEWEVEREGEDKYEFPCGEGEEENIKDFIHSRKGGLTDDQVEKIAAYFDGELRKDKGEVGKTGA